MTGGLWTTKWPNKEGFYWLYGWRFRRRDKNEAPELCLVEVRGTAVKGRFSYVTHGHFLYKDEGCSGLWKKAVLPKLPDITLLEDLKGDQQ